MPGGIIIIVKICGITSLAAAQTAQRGGADFIGFVFAPSRRRITIEHAAAISRQVSSIGKVGVFVNSPAEVVLRTAKLCQLDFVQLHGEESPEYCRSLKIPVIKAFQLAPGFTADRVTSYDVNWILLDSYVPGEAGGTGKTFDWPQAAALIRRINIPVMVAGGLTPDNVTSAIRCLMPQGVDVSGGVETAGSKDLAKIQRFLSAAHSLDERHEN